AAAYRRTADAFTEGNGSLLGRGPRKPRRTGGENIGRSLPGGLGPNGEDCRGARQMLFAPKEQTYRNCSTHFPDLSNGDRNIFQKPGSGSTRHRAVERWPVYIAGMG